MKGDKAKFGHMDKRILDKRASDLCYLELLFGSPGLLFISRGQTMIKSYS